MVRATSVALSIVCGPIICLYITFAACLCPARLRRRTEPEEKRRFERRQKMAPRPLVVRQRALTIPVERRSSYRYDCKKGGGGAGAGGGIEQKTLPQNQSRLMQLPLELRRMIYRHVLGDKTMHMILKEQKLGHLRCKAPSAVDCPLGYNGRTLSRECCWGTVDHANIWSPSSGVKEPTDGNIVPFLRSCRQIYSESIDFLYSTNTFSFSDLDCLRHFSATTLPHRFGLIQNLDIEWAMTWPIYDPIAQQLLISDPVLYPPYDEATWEETWRIIAGMKCLKFIRLSLLYFDGFRDPLCEAKMLAPLRQVKHVPSFEVHVSWDGEQIKDAPFKLIRPVQTDDEDEQNQENEHW